MNHSLGFSSENGSLKADQALINVLISGNEEMISSPPTGFLIGIYLFYEIRSTETFS
jgi:hypothetical protein